MSSHFLQGDLMDVLVIRTSWKVERKWSLSRDDVIVRKWGMNDLMLIGLVHGGFHFCLLVEWRPPAPPLQASRRHPHSPNDLI